MMAKNFSWCFFYFNEDVFVYNFYIPPKGSNVLNHKRYIVFEEIEKGIEKYSKLGKVYVIGDFNSRTSDLNDILEYDRYLDVDYDDALMVEINNIPIRLNHDNCIDNNGKKKLISMCKRTGYIILNGRIHGDQGKGDFTFLLGTWTW
jgi:hypothetical protein